MDDIEDTEAPDSSAPIADQVVDPRELPTRFSLLKTMALSPAHYHHACQQPQDDSLAARLAGAAPTGTKRGDALRIGTAVHQILLLGGDARIYRFAGRRAGKVWDAAQREAAECGCVEILNEREWSLARSVADAIRSNEIAMRLLFDGTIVEERIDWTFVGKATRSTPDARGPNHVVDLKTCQSAQPDVFTRHALRLYYHAQAALYLDAIEASGAPRPEEAFVVAVEKTPPYPVTVLQFSTRALTYGAKLCRTWIEMLNACEASGSWPEYLQDVGLLDVEDDDLELVFDGRRIAV